LHQSGARFWGYTEFMADPRLLEDLAARLARVLPPGLSSLRAELEDNFRAILRNNLDRFDLVSRERFEAQAELLKKTEAKLAALEQRLEQLEQKR
jgi:BMFP domain-containing protein YqiC